MKCTSLYEYTKEKVLQKNITVKITETENNATHQNSVQLIMRISSTQIQHHSAWGHRIRVLNDHGDGIHVLRNCFIIQYDLWL